MPIHHHFSNAGGHTATNNNKITHKHNEELWVHSHSSTSNQHASKQGLLQLRRRTHNYFCVFVPSREGKEELSIFLKPVSPIYPSIYLTNSEKFPCIRKTNKRTNAQTNNTEKRSRTTTKEHSQVLPHHGQGRRRGKKNFSHEGILSRLDMITYSLSKVVILFE